MKTKLIFFALTIFFLAWFSFITPSDRFADPDAFYHITIAQLISQQGPLTNFPALDLTTLGSHYADQHFLFHTLQIPFLQIFDPLDAARVSAITFAALCLLAISIVFYKLNVKLWWLWPVLLIFTQPFTTRLIQGKASPLAIMFWFLGISATLAFICRYNPSGYPFRFFNNKSRGEPCVRPVPDPNLIHHSTFMRRAITRIRPYSALAVVFLVSLAFTLTHGGWILLPISLLLILIGDIIFNIVTQKSARFHISYFILLSPIASFFGCLIGLLAHPNREAMFSFLKVQIFDVAIATPAILRLGTEWNANNLAGSVSMLGVFGIILLLTALAHVLSKDQNSDINNPNQKIVPCTLHVVRSTLLLSPLLLLLFAASLKSLRFTEYFQPLLALITALLASTVNWKEFTKKLGLPSTKHQAPSSWFDKIIPAIIVIALLMIVAQHVATAYSNMHHAPRFLRDQYQEPMAAISAIAEPGDRVYHSMWDEFPNLFYHDQRLRYISGLDPTFLYKASSTLALDYQNLVFNPSSTQADAYSLIHDRLEAKFILIDHERWPILNELISSDNHYTFLAEGDGGVAYKIQP